MRRIRSINQLPSDSAPRNGRLCCAVCGAESGALGPTLMRVRSKDGREGYVCAGGDCAAQRRKAMKLLMKGRRG